MILSDPFRVAMFLVLPGVAMACWTARDARAEDGERSAGALHAPAVHGYIGGPGPFAQAANDVPDEEDALEEEEVEDEPAPGTPSAPPSSGPASRDSLFGLDKPAVAAQTGPRLGGFVDALAAYSYGDPGHWSRGVARLQVVGQGQFAPDVKWKASGRVDVDPVYLWSDFYPDRVKRDQRIDFFWRENYIDVSRDNWALRVGAQQIVWGEVVGLFFADVVSARDMREFLLPSFDIIRIPQWAARAEYFLAGDSKLEIVWIPVPVFDKIGRPGSDFYPVRLPAPLPEELANVFRDPVRPHRDWDNGNFGIRAGTLLSGWDVSAFYYRSFSTQPTFYRIPGDDPAQPFVFEARYDRIWQAGATVTKDLGVTVARAEAVYTHGQGFTSNDPFVAQGVEKRNAVDYIVGFEFVLPSDTRINVQGYQRFYPGGGEGDLALHADGVGASLLVSTKLTRDLEPQLLWIRNLRHGDSMIRPRITWTAAPNVAIAFGADIFTGPADTLFGRFANRDRVYTEVRFDF
jgi:hypothetical protein